MRVRWLGQSAFFITDDDLRVVIDPWGEITKVRFDYATFDGIEADVLAVTHEHADHNAVERVAGAPYVLRSSAGTFSTPIGEVVSVASEHDDVAGTRRGANTIIVFTLVGLRFCHFGDFGQLALRSEQRAAIGNVDILLIPVGGGNTIGSAFSAEIVREIRPRTAIPMHYRTAAVDVFDPADDFIAALPELKVEHLDSSEFELEGRLGERGQSNIVLPAPPLRHLTIAG